MPSIFDILSEIDSCENLFFHGPGGTGKTYAIREVVNKYKQEKTIQVLCPTGKAAVEIGMNALTICKYFGIGCPSISSELEIVKYLRSVGRRFNPEKKPDLIIVDEISMVGAITIRSMDAILRRKYCSSKVFGGIQVIFSGDFYQLPPVKDGWCFTTQVWTDLSLVKIDFDVGHRYTSQETFDTMMRIRKGNIGEEDLALLRERTVIPKMEVMPILLYPYNADVDRINYRELERLKSEIFTSEAEDEIAYKFKCMDDLQNHSASGYVNPEVTRKQKLFAAEHKRDAEKSLDDICPKSVSIKVGCKVLICRNDGELVNGTIAKVVGIKDGEVEIQTISGARHIVVKKRFEYSNDFFVCARTQYPFKLGWAISIHKSQGMTLESAIIQLEKIRTEGQAYVAISRVRDINKLYIFGKVESNAIFANKLILEKFD